jgi:murein DD-endopeptidase MepM/ murein hydrolase activator NlpD
VSAELDRLTAGLERMTHRVENGPDVERKLVVALAVDAAGMRRLERSLTRTRVAAAALLEPLTGPIPNGETAAAIERLFVDDDTGYVEAPSLRAVVSAWRRLDAAVNRALEVRDLLRVRLGLVPLAGVRTCPLDRVGKLAADWGDPRGWRSHRGNDVNAPEGTPLMAMEDGEVVQMGWHWLGGYGIYVRGDTTGDVYYFAHLSAYAEDIVTGTRVEAGRVVGYVGNTGNSDLPHLHLGWMPGAGRVDLDGLADAYSMLVELCL